MEQKNAIQIENPSSGSRREIITSNDSPISGQDIVFDNTIQGSPDEMYYTKIKKNILITKFIFILLAAVASGFSIYYIYFC